MWGPEGRCYASSEALARWVQCDPADFLVHGWTKFIAVDSRQTLRSAMDAVQSGRINIDPELTLCGRDGLRVDVRLRFHTCGDPERGTRQVFARVERVEGAHRSVCQRM
jgi:hypothetical protein